MIRRSALVLAALGACVVSACGGGSNGNGTGEAAKGGSGGLTWVQKPAVYVPGDLPNDRVLSGTLRNDSFRRLRIKATDLELRDARGHAVNGSVAFLNGYLHGLYPPTREPQIDDKELVRTGRLAKLDPGKQSPIVVSWRVRGGQDPPVSLTYGDLVLPVPTTVTRRR